MATEIGNLKQRMRGLIAWIKPLLLILLLPVAVLAIRAGEAKDQAGIISTELGPARLEKLVGGLSHPWGMSFLPDGRLFITERGGTAVIYADGKTQPISGLPAIVTGGQPGLLDVAVAPDFATSRQIFLTFVRKTPNGSATTLASYHLDAAALSDEKILLTGADHVDPIQYGSRIRFDAAGHILVTLGDRGQHMQNWPQQLNQLAGKLVRLNRDGTVPTDNPFVHTPGARPEIFALGLRNPQGLAIEPGTGRIFETEHGPMGGDEINIITAGANYGWPIVGYGINYSGALMHKASDAPGFAPPFTYYVPSIGICGAEFHDGSGAPAWRGNLIVAGLPEKSLRRLVIDGDRLTHQEIIFTERIGRVRDVAIGPDGAVYILNDEDDAGLWRLSLL